MMRHRDIPKRLLTILGTNTVEAGAAGGEGGADGGGAGGAPAGGGEAAPFYEAFTNDALKSSPAIQRYKTVEDLAGGFVALEKRFGIDPARRIDMPEDPNDEAGMRAIYTKLGLPEKADGYGFKLDDKATDADKAFVSEAAETFHKLGLPAPMAQGIMKFYAEKAAQANADAAAAETARIAEGKQALQKEFGAAYEPRLREIEGLVTKYAEPDLAEALKGDGLLAYPNLGKFLGKILNRMAEPGAAGGDGGDGATGERLLTPAQARAAVTTFMADPVKSAALLDNKHPQHKAVLEERSRLLRQSEGWTPDGKRP